MKPAKAPAAATWLLRHFAFGQNEALAGDLMEELGQGRTSSWYWRQVFVAILTSFQNEVRTEWTSGGKAVIWTFGFAVVWYCVVSECWNYVDAAVRGIILAGWFVMPSWWRFLGYPATSGALMLAAGVAIFLTILRSWSLKNFVRGLSTGLLVLAIQDVGVRFFLSRFGLDLWRILSFLWTWFSWVPLFAAVLLSVWMAQPRQSRWGKSLPHA